MSEVKMAAACVVHGEDARMILDTIAQYSGLFDPEALGFWTASVKALARLCSVEDIPEEMR